MSTEAESTEAIIPSGRRRKVWGKWLKGGLAVLLALGLLAGPWPTSWVDAFAKDEVRVHASGLERLADWPIHLPQTGPIRVGTAVIPITDLAEGQPLAGYAHRVFRNAEGVADPIDVRALVIEQNGERFAIITGDLLLINEWLAAAVLEELGGEWAADRLFFGATHTHSGPSGYPSRLVESTGLGRFHAERAQTLAKRLAQAVRLANEDLRPAEFAFTSVEADPLTVRNRTQPEDPANGWLDLLAFRDPENQAPLATVAIFAAHATTRRAVDHRVSSDYPGVLRSVLEEEWGGRVLFLAGAVGSMGPPNTVIRRNEQTDWLGRNLAESARTALQATEVYQPAPIVAAIGGNVPLPSPRVKLGRNWRLSPIAAGVLLPSEAWMGGLRIGPCVLVATPADFSGVLALALRDVQPDVTVVTTSFSRSYVGYVLPESYDPLDQYEPSSMSLYGRGLGNMMGDWMGAIVHRLNPTPLAFAGHEN